MLSSHQPPDQTAALSSSRTTRRLVLAGSGNGLLDQRALLLAGDHGLEAVEVVELGARLLVLQLLGPRRVLPLGERVGLGQRLLERLLARLEGDLHRQVRERQTLEVDHVAVHARDTEGAVNEGLVLVHHVDDRGDLAGVRAVVDEHHTADRNEASESLLLPIFILFGNKGDRV